MSLFIFYRNHFVADMSATINEEKLSVFERIQKTYLSEDHYFAAACVGSVPTPKHWEKIRELCLIYEFKSKTDREQAELNLRDALVPVFIELRAKHSTAYVIFGEFFIRLEYLGSNFTGVIGMNHLNPELPYTDGTGKYGANVLIQYDKVPEFETFFYMVSMGDPGITREFTKIDLSEVIGTPWYLKAQEAIKKKVARISSTSRKKNVGKPKTVKVLTTGDFADESSLHVVTLDQKKVKTLIKTKPSDVHFSVFPTDKKVINE